MLAAEDAECFCSAVKAGLIDIWAFGLFQQKLCVTKGVFRTTQERWGSFGVMHIQQHLQVCHQLQSQAGSPNEHKNLWESLSPNLFLIFVERHSKGKKGLHFGNLRIASLCFAVVLLVSLEFALQHSLERDESPYLQVWGHCSLLENNGMLPLGWGGESASSKFQVLIHKWWEDGDVSVANGLVLSQKTATWNLSYDWKSNVVGTSG